MDNNTEDFIVSQVIEVSPSGKKLLNQKKLMRYLVNLVSYFTVMQSMIL